ncbi:hypothetical protein AMATHDRAFT_148472 [Amanita thiersii Skay4041]|uniref:ABC transporter domain-containing protein n=1 Tax=Amanita thiersii Skay4041 TaxID=703135 RepID=A0A2A9NN21_9AGAR|nr:hypothetical protein AMATHDRAFT_148472 [Amanita thiersii Skay4041]
MAISLISLTPPVRREKASIKARQLGVMFRNLRVVGLGSMASYIPTFGSMFNPAAMLESIQSLRHPPLRDILSGFEGVVRPSEMLLVLGRPGSGCTTFLKALSNRRSEYHSIEGEVHYDSLSPAEIHSHYRGDVQYCPEDDVHFPTLTVEQTIKFAAKTRAPNETQTDRICDTFDSTATDILISIFGLGHARHTPIGNAAIRGVSGGEKKRVSLAEVLATRACLAAWDNPTRGLDSSTALEFVQALRTLTDMFSLTTVASVYQAGEPLYRHFDKVCVLYEGKMAYFGPADRARQYFIDMGYQPANRQTTADFLVAVTDPNGRIPRPGVAHLPRTADEFAQYFKHSQFGVSNRRDMSEYEAEYVNNEKRAMDYRESARAEFMKHARADSPYLLTIAHQAKVVMLRRVQILRGDMLTTGLNLFAFVFQALIVGSVFLKLQDATSDFFSRGGVLFFALLFSALNTMAEIPSLYAQRPIVLRHQRAALYHPFVEALAMTLVDIPIAILTIVVFSIILYFMVGLQRTAVFLFSIFILFLFAMMLTMKAWFRAIAAAFATEPLAQTVAGISILAIAIYTGYTIPKPTMIGALRWITYINVHQHFSFESILSNEFRTLQAQCSTLVPSGPGYENVTIANQVCPVVGAELGKQFVDGNRFVELSYGFKFSHTWMNFGIVVAFGIGFFIALLTFTELNTSTSHEGSIVTFKRSSRKIRSHTPTSNSQDIEKMQPHNSDKLRNNEKKGYEDLPIRKTDVKDVFSWQHISYTVHAGSEDKMLLDDVSGYVAPGKMTALMGESGAGKTTLLNVLAQRVSTGVVRGDFFVNGQALPIDFQSQTGYCQQMDTHVSTSTVREALLFSAKLRQPASVPLAEKEAYVETCLKMCGLEEFADASVGSLGVEQRKRTTIAVELAAKPKLLLFLDEPTSGLDSQSAWNIVSFLRRLADSGQAILCTIHQPSAELFQVFDKLLLLRKGGKTVYFGDLGLNATTLIHYFEKNGARSCLPDENPAEYMLDVIGAGATATSKQDWYEVWRYSPGASGVQQELDRIHADGRNRPALEATIRSEFASSWVFQVKELLKRDAEAHWRNPTYITAKLILNIVGGLFIGFTFFKAKDTQQGTQNKLFAVFMATILSVPLSNQLQVEFINMRSVYEIRERASRMYSWTALLTSQLLVELPWNILGSTLLFLTWYWTVGFPSSRAGYTFLMLGIIYPLYYTSIAQAIAAMAPNAEIAAVLFSTLFSFVIMFNGVLQPFRKLGWWQWMYRLSPYTYLVEGLLGQALGRQQITCSPIEYVTLNPPSGQTCAQYLNPFISFAGGYLTNPNVTSSCQFCSMRTTDQFLGASFNIFYSHRWRNVGLMAAFICFNIVCTYLLTYLFRIHTGSLFSFLKPKSKPASNSNPSS